MCIQKLFILIKMMCSGIKWMVLCIAHHFRMRVNALKGRSHKKSHHACSWKHRLCFCAVGKVWLFDSVTYSDVWNYIQCSVYYDSSIIARSWTIIEYLLAWFFNLLLRILTGWGGASISGTFCIVGCRMDWLPNTFFLSWVGYRGGINFRVKHGATLIQQEEGGRPVAAFPNFKNCEWKIMAETLKFIGGDWVC